MTQQGKTAQSHRAIERWRLVLGRTSENRFGANALGAGSARIDRVLDYLYNREQAGRGIRTGPAGPGGVGDERHGSLDPSQITALQWLGEVRDLFPADVYETIQGHALDRYGMRELLTDPQVLQTLTPNMNS